MRSHSHPLRMASASVPPTSTSTSMSMASTLALLPPSLPTSPSRPLPPLSAVARPCFTYQALRRGPQVFRFQTHHLLFPFSSAPFEHTFLFYIGHVCILPLSNRSRSAAIASHDYTCAPCYVLIICPPIHLFILTIIQNHHCRRLSFHMQKKNHTNPRLHTSRYIYICMCIYRGVFQPHSLTVLIRA